LTVIGGRVLLYPDLIERPSDLLNPKRYEVRSSTLFGLRAEHPLTDRLTLSAAQYYTPGADSEQGKGITTASLQYAFGRHRRAALELARSSHGMGWQVSGENEGKRLRVRANYRQVETGFSSAGNPALRTNRSGYAANLGYRLTRNLDFGMATQRYDDGFGGDYRYDSASVQFSSRRLPTVSLFWQSRRDDPSLASGGIPVTVEGPGIRLSKNFGSTYLSLGYERLKFRFSTTPESNTDTDRFSLGVLRALGKRTNLSLYHTVDLNREVGKSDRRVGHSTQVNVSHRVGRRGFVINLGLERQSSVFAGDSGHFYVARAGFDLPLGENSTLGIAYRKSLGASGFLSSVGRDTVYIRYSRALTLGKRPAPGRIMAMTVAEQERRTWGKISGRIFEDLNGDGIWQEGEPPVSDVNISIEGDITTQTDAEGKFVIEQVFPGEHQVRLGLNTLPIEFTLLTPTEVVVQTPRKSSAVVNFPVVRTGDVSGIVFNDVNRDGHQDSGEQGVANAVVRVEGSEVIGFTDENGYFTLLGLAPKQWKIFVDVESLSLSEAETYEATKEAFKTVTVPAGRTADGLTLGIVRRERPVIETFRSEVPASPSASPGETIHAGEPPMP
jgi:hypothetical protein